MVENFVGYSTDKSYELKDHSKAELYAAIKCFYDKAPGYYPVLNLDSAYNQKFGRKDHSHTTAKTNQDSIAFYFEERLNDSTAILYWTYIDRGIEHWTEAPDYPSTTIVLDAIWKNDRVYFISKKKPPLGATKKEAKEVKRYVKKFEKTILREIRKNAKMNSCH